MKKRIAAVVAALFFASIAFSGASAVTVEQTNASPPDFKIYLYESDADLGTLPLSGVSAYYDGRPMEVTGLTPASETGTEVFYIYALDISASIPRYIFSAMKSAILEAYDRLRKNEEMALITFGNTVETRLRGGETREYVEKTLDSLSPDDMNTDFYGAVKRIIELFEQRGEGRKIGVIFSDGVDDIYAGFTKNELESGLRGGGVSVNAMCVSGVNSDAVSNFGEIARLSGGELFLFDHRDAGDKLSELIRRVDGCYALTLRSATNITDGKAHAITIKLGELPAVTIEVTPTAWIPDDTAPEATGIVWDNAELSLIVTFSEPVSGASELGAFVIRDKDGNHIRLAGVTYSEDGERPVAALRFEEVPVEGEYSLSFFGIKDVSMEENPLASGPADITLKTGITPAVPSPAPHIEIFTSDNGRIYYLLAGVLLLIIAAAVIFILLGVSKKKRETENRLDRLENRPVVGQGSQTGNRIIIPKAQGIKVQMSIFDGKGKKYSIAQDIITSLFIGKHSGNDLVIEDSRVSRQHAVIEKKENALAISDLNSTNGTFVNGARITYGAERKIEPGDEIMLGDTTIRVISIS